MKGTRFQKKREPRVISERAHREIDERVQLARPVMLSELCKVVRSRRGAITQLQYVAVADLIRLTGGSQDTLSEWLTEAQAIAPADDADDSAVAATETVGYGLDAAGLRALFGIDDDLSELLTLRLLVSERLRSRLRRREEGISARGPRPPPSASWEAAGISRTAWYQAKKTAPLWSKGHKGSARP